MTALELNMIAEAVAEKLLATLLNTVRDTLTQPQQKDFLTLEETSQYTGLSKSTLYKLTHGRKIPYFKPHGKMCFFRRKDLDEWMSRNPVATEEELDTRAQAYCIARPLPKRISTLK